MDLMRHIQENLNQAPETGSQSVHPVRGDKMAKQMHHSNAFLVKHTGYDVIAKMK